MASLIQRLRKIAPTREQIEAHPWLAGMAPQLANPKLWHWSRRSVAAGAAIGLFIGLAIPFAQIVLAAVAAVVLRANVPIAAACTLVTNPLTVPPIYFAAYHLGRWATGAESPASVSFTDPASLWENFGAIGMPLFTGLGIAALVGAAATYLLVSQAWAIRVAARRRRAQGKVRAR
jgi:uncharacterized protein (DUF2062 family)